MRDRSSHSVSFTYDLIHIMDFWYLILLPVTLSINPSFLYSNVVKLQDTDNHSERMESYYLLPVDKETPS